MKAWGRRQVLWAGLALLVATNAIVLGGALYNRSGEPEATLRLSERELRLPYRWGFQRENSGIALDVVWRVLRAPKRDDNSFLYTEGTPWLDKAKLVELGFDMSRSPFTDGGRRYYAKQLPREAFLVLDFDGAAYRTALRRAEERAKRAADRAAASPAVAELKSALERANRDVEDEREKDSRLFVIDAGLDGAALRARYADRSHYAIVRGIVRLTTERRGSDSIPVGYVSSLSVSDLNVPAEHRAPFASAYKGSDVGAPDAGKYEVGVAFGKRLEPWITDLRRSGKQRSL